jgi:hypothetical protein
MALGMATGLRNARLDAITTFAGNAGKLRIYDGTRPATGGTATTLLAEFILGSPLAAASSAGVLTITNPSNVTASATSTATWARIVKSDGTTHVTDMSVGTSGTDIILNTTSITSGVTVSITSATLTDGNP